MNACTRFLLLLFAIPSIACATRPKPKSTVLFLCPYGGAKSVIAASYFNRMMEERGLPYAGVAAAAEEPYVSVPASVADFLGREGFEVRAFRPRRVDAEDLAKAIRIVSIDCNIDLADAAIERWDDVPKVSVDLEASVAAILKHVEALADELR